MKFRWGILFVFMAFFSRAQDLGIIKGQVTDEEGKPLEGVNILAGKNRGAITDSLGVFEIRLQPGSYKLTFSYLGFETRMVAVHLKAKEVKILNLRLIPVAERIKSVTIVGRTRKEKEGAVKINREVLQVTPGISSGVKNVLMSLPSVSQLDELSSQYFVRGGNFDENAVFINGIRVYRPLLSRSGKQEGLSIVNSDLIERLFFYAGSFPTELGDKLSSVLDIHYKQPEQNGWQGEASFTGVRLSGAKRWNKNRYGLAGLRYQNNTLLVKSTEGEAEFQPSFLDFQALYHFEPGSKWHHEILMHVATNRYRFIPHTKQTNFGTFADAKALVIQYNGQEKDAYDSQFAAWKTRFVPGKNRAWTFIQSAYHSFEKEYFDILASYFIGEPNTDLSGGNLGDPMNLQALGQDLNHARNLLDALIFSSEVKYENTRGKIRWKAGAKYKYDNIRDRMKEYQVLDSAGFFILPPYSTFHPEEPYVSDTIPVMPFQFLQADHLAEIHRVTVFAEGQRNIRAGTFSGTISAGIRMNRWFFHEKFSAINATGFAWSPRIMLYGKWEKWPSHFWRFGTGIYMQPPEYKEWRDFSGQIHTDVRAQKAWNISLSDAYKFIWRDIPFILTSEIYYRYLWDVNPYAVENIRIKYYARNNAVAYAHGAELRLNGELLPGTQSWLSLAYMKTEQNIEGRGYIPRPTDQRFKMALMFQDYIPSMPQFKMYLNNVFSTGLPTGAPSYADPYTFLFRTRNYWRTDIGLFYVPRLKKSQRNFLKKLNDFSVGVEIINAFGRRNSVSNLWVREIYTKRMYGVPNYLTGRIFNVKLKWAF